MMREHDWSHSPLGPPASWPQSLRSVVGLLLQSQFPMFVAWGKELGFLYNDPYAEVLGSKHPQSLGSRFYDIWSEIWPDISPLIEAAMAGRATYRENLPLLMNRRGYDEQTWFTFSYSPVRDESGAVAGMFCVCTETTELMLAERARGEAHASVVRSEQRLRALVTATSDIIYRMNPDWTEMLELAGRGFLEDTEQPRASWLANYIHPDDQAMIAAAIDKAIATKSVFELEHRVRRADGTWGWTASRAIPIFDANGDLLEWFGAATDITSRKEDEQALQQQVATTVAERNLLADMVEGTDSFVQVFDLDFRFMAINRASADEFERVFGVRPRVGQTIDEVLAHRPDDLVQVKGLWGRALAGEAFTTVQAFGDPDNDRRSYEIRFNVLRNREGQRIGAYQFVHDVTERLRDQARLRAAEEALRQSQKMEAVGQLTGGLAHDFNNLLAAIGGSVSLIEKRLKDGKPGIEKYLDATRDAVRRAATLTQRLLAFSRRQTLDPKPVDLNRLIGGMEELIRRTMGPQVEVEVRGAEGLWATRLDISQLENSLLNLCINARDAMLPNPGVLVIETSNQIFDEEAARARDVAPGQYVALRVIDVGTGMTPEVVARAFDPFFTTKPLGQGTGLGLSMIYGFVRQSGGNVSIESRVGRGTQITLLFPRYSGAVEPGAEPAEADGGIGCGSQTLLVVDDEPIMRMLIADVLREAGYRILLATDGSSATKIIESDAHIDLLVTDVGLPGGMNGRQIADFARLSRPDLRVLFITGYVENAAVGDGQLEPGMELLTKPFEMHVLAERIQTMLQS